MGENKISHKVIRELVALPTPSQTEADIPLTCTFLRPTVPELLLSQRHVLESEDEDENNLQFLPQRVTMKNK